MGIQLNNGKYALNLQKLTFGAGNFDNLDRTEDYFHLLDIYYNDFVGRSFDTARIYGKGISEQVLGKWIRERGIPRDEIVITTKGGHPPLDDMHSHRLNRDSICFDMDASLAALGLSYVDIYLLHRDCEALPVGGIMDALNELVKAGKTRFIGVSNWSTARIAEANRYAADNGLVPLSISQINFSLARTTPEQLQDDTLVCMNEENYKWYLKNHFPVMAFSSQAKGFFSKLIANEGATPKIQQRFVTEENLKRLERVKALSEKLKVSPAAAALAYLTCNPVQTSAVFSCRTEEQLRDTMSAKGVTLDGETVRLLEG